MPDTNADANGSSPGTVRPPGPGSAPRPPQGPDDIGEVKPLPAARLEQGKVRFEVLDRRKPEHARIAIEAHGADRGIAGVPAALHEIVRHGDITSAFS